MSRFSTEKLLNVELRTWISYHKQGCGLATKPAGLYAWGQGLARIDMV